LPLGFSQTVSEKMLKKISAAAYMPDLNNKDGVFVAQHQQTKKWGMFQACSEKDIKQMIPMQYDSIDFFGYNAKLTGVWNKGKVGIFLSPWSYVKKMQSKLLNAFTMATKFLK
jgi:hypothetical protein